MRGELFLENKFKTEFREEQQKYMTEDLNIECLVKRKKEIDRLFIQKKYDQAIEEYSMLLAQLETRDSSELREFRNQVLKHLALCYFENGDDDPCREICLQLISVKFDLMNIYRM